MIRINAVYVRHLLNKEVHPIMPLLNIQLSLIFGLTYIVNTVPMKLLMSPDFEENTTNTYKILTKILDKCFHGNLNPLILSNVINQQLIDYFSLEYPMSLILMDKNFDLNKTQAQWTSYYPNSASFVLIVDLFNEFKKILNDIYLSVWSNNDSNFIIISLDSCQNSQKFLSMLWKRKFLSAIFLCYNDVEDIVQLYTYNPFTDRAPHPWRKVWNNQTWTLYQRNYQEDENVCLNLIYDKIKYFDGYKIKAVGFPKPGVTWNTDMDYDISSLIEKLPYFNAQYGINIFLKTNITAIISYSRTLDLEKYQFLLTSQPPSQLEKNVYATYPHRQVPPVIVTQKKPFLSPEEKILSFYSSSIILLVIFSFGTLFIALMLNKRQSWLSAVMELIRLVIFTGILQPLNRLPLRIYLFGILWLVIILNATFQGQLAKFLTRPERQSINSIADLKKFKYKVYVNYLSFQPVSFTLSEMQLSANVIENLNGYKVVLNDSRVAYITAFIRAYEPAYKHQLHVSESCGFFSYQTFRMSLPIKKRIDELLSRYTESGLQNYWDKHDIDQYKTNLTNTEEWETSPQVRPLTISDILFMFKFLAIGLGISFGVFLIEVTAGIKYTNYINQRNIPQIDFTL